MKNILVIEDEEFVRETISDMLEIEGYIPILAKNGEAGLECLSQIKPDLILCDINMPVMDGYEVLERLKSTESLSTIPFIFLTAKASNDDMRRGMELGADDYIFKPFKAKDLLNAINTRLEVYDRSKIMTETKLDELRLQLASSLPHEFRTPLNVILATSQFLHKKMDLMEKNEIKDMIYNIVNSGNRLSKLISNYLVYTNLLLNKEELDFKDKVFTNYTIDPEDMLENSFLRMASEYERMEDLEINCVPAVINVYPEYFLKISDELASNAFKFSKDGTKINVSTHIEDENYILTVKDNGIGFDLTKLDEIGGFKQFGRKTMEQQGMGLGLAIIKLVCQRFNIDLKINSIPDEGTTFTLKLPIKKESI
ncbi:MAG: response regulator [Ignavibacteriae bacterium]|nr:response regulator [Ignavibacteriota bacterium]